MNIKKYWHIVIVVILFLVMIPVNGQKNKEGNEDYQYALIEAVKQKNLGNLPEAVKLYKLVIQAKPDCDAAYYELGTIFLSTNETEPAIENLEKAYTLRPENTWYSLAYINALEAGDNYKKAISILKIKIREEPEEVEWQYQLANAYMGSGLSKRADKNKKSQVIPRKNASRALRILNKVEKKNGFSEKITLAKASVFENQGKYLEAKREIEKVLDIFPEAIQFRIVAAELCAKSGLNDEAANYYHQVFEIDSTNIFALTNLTDYYRKKEDYKKSFYYLTKSFQSGQIDGERKLAILTYYLSEEKYILGYPNELEKLVTVYLDEYPENSKAKLLAVDFYIDIKKYEKAYYLLKDFLDNNGGVYPLYMQAVLLSNAASLNSELISISDEAIRQFPDSTDLYFFKGIGLYQTEQFDSLIQCFDSVSFDRFSNQEYRNQALMLYAESYYRTGEYHKSDSIFEDMIDRDPANYLVLNNYSFYLAERGERLEKARTWSHEAVRNNPDNATFIDTYAWVLFKLGNYEEAEQYIMEALDKGGANDPEINEHAGDILNALKSPALAQSFYEKAIILGGNRENLEKKIQTIDNNETD